jgi:hypothetical protein
MKDSYRYVIHAYEDARQKRPIKHEHGGPPSSPTAMKRYDEPKSSPGSSPVSGLHPPRVQRGEVGVDKTTLLGAERYPTPLLLSTTLRPSSQKAGPRKPKP